MNNTNYETPEEQETEETPKEDLNDHIIAEIDDEFGGNTNVDEALGARDEITEDLEGNSDED